MQEGFTDLSSSQLLSSLLLSLLNFSFFPIFIVFPPFFLAFYRMQGAGGRCGAASGEEPLPPPERAVRSSTRPLRGR